MVSPSNQIWQAATITLTSKVDGSTTREVLLSNRPFYGDLNSGVVYWPILADVPDVGVENGDYVPLSKSASLVIDDSPGSFGYQRRFSDLFERYAAVGATVELYSAQTTLTDVTVTADLSLDWTSTVKDWSRSNGRLTLSLVEEGLPKRTVTKLIDQTSFPSAPTAAFGKYLPIVIGESVEVKPILTLDSTTPEFSYATTLADDFIVSGVQEIYVKDRDGQYQPVNSSGAVGTAVHSVADGGSTTLATQWNVEGATLVTMSGPYLLTQLRMRFAGTGDAGWASSNGKLQFTIYEYDEQTALPGAALAVAEVAKSTYQTQNRGATNTSFWVEGAFNKATYVEQFFLGWSQTEDVGATDDPMWVRNNAGVVTVYELLEDDNPKNRKVWTSSASPDSQVIYDLYACHFTDYANPSSDKWNSEGLGHALFTVEQKTALGGINNPSLSGLDFVITIDGLRDDGSGSATGTPNEPLVTANTALIALNFGWNGSAWVSGFSRFDWTKFSDTHDVAFDDSDPLYRRLGGRTDGRVTLDQLVITLCRNSASKVVRYNGSTTQLALYAWGTTGRTSVATITDEDSIIANHRQVGTESLVNRINAPYDRRLISVDVTNGAAQGSLNNFAKTLDWDAETDSLTDLLVGISKDLYGTRELSSQVFEFLDDSDSAEVVGQFIFVTYGEPHQYVELIVPFHKYRTIDNMDIVTIVHPELPAFFGTTSNAKLPTYAGEEVEMLDGFYLKRAKPYRAQVEGRIVSELDGFPVLRLNCRLLTNPHDLT